MSIERLERSHASLFSLPRYETAISASFLLAFALSFLETILRVTTLFFYTLLHSFLCFSLLIFTFPLLTLTLVKKENTVLNRKRSFWAAILSTGMGGVVYLVGRTFHAYDMLPFFGAFLALTGIGLKLFWDLLVTYALSTLSMKKAMGIVFPGVLLFLGCKFFLVPLDSFLTEMGILLLLTIGIFAFMVSVLVYFVNFFSASKVNVKGIDLFRGFVFVWLNRRRENLERLLEKLSVEKTLPVYVTLFKGGAYRGIWIIPTVHPGPLLNVGSSDMTARISSALRRKFNAPTMIFHGACSHSENLTGISEQNKLLEMILSHIDEATLADKLSPPIKIVANSISVFSQMFGKRALLSVSRSPKPMDDITLDVGLAGEHLIEKTGVEGVIIDTHNSIGLERKEGQEVRITDPLADEIMEGIQNASQTLSKIPERRKVNAVNFGIATHSGNLSLSEGLGPEGVKVAVLEITGKQYAYVLLDANNLESGIREEIIDKLKHSFAIEEGEVYTSDTHIMNATGSKGGYPLITHDKKEKLLEGVVTATEEAIRKKERVTVYNLTVRPQLKVYGAESASALMYFGENSVRFFNVSLLVSLLPAFITTFFIVLLSFLL